MNESSSLTQLAPSVSDEQKQLWYILNEFVAASQGSHE